MTSRARNRMILSKCKGCCFWGFQIEIRSKVTIFSLIQAGVDSSANSKPLFSLSFLGQVEKRFIGNGLS